MQDASPISLLPSKRPLGTLASRLLLSRHPSHSFFGTSKLQAQALSLEDLSPAELSGNPVDLEQVEKLHLPLKYNKIKSTRPKVSDGEGQARDARSSEDAREEI